MRPCMAAGKRVASGYRRRQRKAQQRQLVRVIRALDPGAPDGTAGGRIGDQRTIFLPDVEQPIVLVLSGDRVVPLRLQEAPYLIGEALRHEPDGVLRDPPGRAVTIERQPGAIGQHAAQRLHQAFNQRGGTRRSEALARASQEIAPNRFAIARPDQFRQRAVAAFATQIIGQLLQQRSLFGQPTQHRCRHELRQQDQGKAPVRGVAARGGVGEVDPVARGPELEQRADQRIPHRVRLRRGVVGNAQIVRGLAHVVQQRREEHRISPAMLRALLGLGRRPGRQHQTLPALERVQRSLQAMQRHAARLGMMVRLGRGQQLGEFEGAIDHRRVVALEILGRSVRVGADAGDQAVHLQPGDQRPRLPAPAAGRPAPIRFRWRASCRQHPQRRRGCGCRLAPSRQPSIRPNSRIHAAAVIGGASVHVAAGNHGTPGRRAQLEKHQRGLAFSSASADCSCPRGLSWPRCALTEDVGWRRATLRSTPALDRGPPVAHLGIRRSLQCLLAGSTIGPIGPRPELACYQSDSPWRRQQSAMSSRMRQAPRAVARLLLDRKADIGWEVGLPFDVQRRNAIQRRDNCNLRSSRM